MSSKTIQCKSLQDFIIIIRTTRVGPIDHTIYKKGTMNTVFNVQTGTGMGYS